MYLGGVLAIGDVTFSPNDMPIVIGDKEYRGQGIAKKVITALIGRAKELGYTELNIREIYDFNTPSQGLFQSCGFVPYSKTDNGSSYRLILH